MKLVKKWKKNIVLNGYINPNIIRERVFKKDNGYKHSIELSKKYNLYRQNYCGCKYSVREKKYD